MLLLFSRGLPLCRGTKPHPNLDLDARSEPVKDRYEAIHGKPSEVCIPDSGKIGRRNPGAGMRGSDAQALPVERFYDFGGEDRLELFHVCIFMSEVAENVPAAPRCFQPLPFHRNISLNALSRS
jgi:hypothetical protein